MCAAHISTKFCTSNGLDACCARGLVKLPSFSRFSCWLAGSVRR